MRTVTVTRDHSTAYVGTRRLTNPALVRGHGTKPGGGLESKSFVNGLRTNTGRLWCAEDRYRAYWFGLRDWLLTLALDAGEVQFNSTSG